MKKENKNERCKTGEEGKGSEETKEEIETFLIGEFLKK